MNISVVIPCIHFHFKHLPGLLNRYSQQTLIPKEIIITVSEYNKIDNTINLENQKYPFILRIIKNNEKKRAGENRQIGSEEASGKYIVYQDADDIPHFQRIEIMNYFFEVKNANHITHLLAKSPRELSKTPYILENIPNVEWKKRGHRKGFRPTTMGNIGIRKDIIKTIKWTSHFVGEDTRFTDTILEKYDKCFRIGVTLLYYRKHLSSFRIIDRNTY